MSTLIDKDYKNDDHFIENVFKTFKPSKESAEVYFENKWKYFLEDAKSEKDTIRYSALNSIEYLNLGKEDLDNVFNFIDTFDFKESEIDAKLSFIGALGEIKDGKIIPYLEKLYKKEEGNSIIQFKILSALTEQKSDLAYKKIIELLEFETPLIDNNYQIGKLFRKFSKDFKYSKNLYPAIFQFYTIEEYKLHILDFCYELLDKKEVDISGLNSYKKIILNDAKLEQKRLMSWKNEQDSKTEEEKNNIYYQNQEPPLETLTSYLDILYQFPTDEAINELIAKLRKMEIPELNTELNRLDVMHNRSNKDYLTKSLENIDTRFMTSLLLLYKNQKDAITYSDDEMATAALYHLEKLKEKDSIHFLEKRIVKRDNIETTFYFYQVIKKVEEDEPETKELMTVAFISKDGKLNLRAYNSFKNEEIIDESDLPEIKNTLINEALNRGNLRTNYIIMKNLYGYYPDLYDY